MNGEKTLSRSAKTVQDVLTEKGLALEVMELSASTRTAEDAALAIGCEIAQIVKSLLFKTTKTNNPVLILASGVNQVNVKSIEKMIDEKIEKADANFVREVTGFAVGGVPPLGHKQEIPHVFIDKDLLQFETLWAAAGTPNAVFKLRSADIVQLTKGILITIK